MSFFSRVLHPGAEPETDTSAADQRSEMQQFPDRNAGAWRGPDMEAEAPARPRWNGNDHLGRTETPAGPGSAETETLTGVPVPGPGWVARQARQAGSAAADGIRKRAAAPGTVEHKIANLAPRSLAAHRQHMAVNHSRGEQDDGTRFVGTILKLAGIGLAELADSPYGQKVAAVVLIAVGLIIGFQVF